MYRVEKNACAFPEAVSSSNREVASVSDKPARIKEFEGLRGIAALSVLAFHYLYHYHRLYGHSFSPPEWLQLGMFGYHLFFILSGFLIFRSLESSGSIARFVKSRIFRLYPTFWVAVVITFIGVSLMGLPGRERTFKELIVNLTMAPHVFDVRYIDRVYWTLSYEISFYVIITLLFASGALKRLEITLGLWLGLQCGILGISWFIWRKPPAHPWDALLMARYSNLFILGMLLHRILDRIPRRTVPPTAFGILCSATRMEWALIAWVTGIATLVDPQALFVLPLIVVIFFLIQSRSSLVAPLRWAGLLYMGTISYPLYLIHQNLGYALIHHGYLIGWHPLLSIGLAITSSFLLAALLHHSVEAPGVALGKQAFEGAHPRLSAKSEH